MSAGHALEPTLKALRAGDRTGASDYGLLRKHEFASWLKAGLAFLLAVKIAVLVSRAVDGGFWAGLVLAIGVVLALHWGVTARCLGRLRREYERTAPPTELRPKGPEDFEPSQKGNS